MCNLLQFNCDLCDVILISALQEVAAVYCEILRAFPLSFDSAVVSALMKWVSRSVADVVLREASLFLLNLK